MGDENRGSSGSGTVMIVVAILGGILLVGCCGSVVVAGAGLFWVRHETRPVQMAPNVPEIPDLMEPTPDEKPAPAGPAQEKTEDIPAPEKDGPGIETTPTPPPPDEK